MYCTEHSKIFCCRPNRMQSISNSNLSIWPLCTVFSNDAKFLNYIYSQNNIPRQHFPYSLYLDPIFIFLDATFSSWIINISSIQIGSLNTFIIITFPLILLYFSDSKLIFSFVKALSFFLYAIFYIAIRKKRKRENK